DRTAIAAFPINHGTGLSMLDGDRPDESDIQLIQLEQIPSPIDDSDMHYAVQEPQGDSAPGVQFFIATRDHPFIPDPQTSGPIHQQALRLGGAYFDTGGDLQYQHAELDLAAIGETFWNANGTAVVTPDSGGWKPSLVGTHFESAVLH